MADKSFTKIIVLIVFGTIAAISFTIWSANIKSDIENFDDRVSAIFEKSNTIIDREESIISNFYRLVDSNHKAGIEYMDSIILYGGFDANDQIDFNWIVGEVYYDLDSIDLALARFDTSLMKAPRNLANIAGCYIKQKRYKEAKPLLKKAAGINKSYTWYVGNFFEIVGERDSASMLYGNLYGDDPLIYQYCDERLVNMSRADYKRPEYLEYRNRRKRTYVRLNR